nr:MAG TPA: hypothetical protein [Caudoviricetes sp.]
MFTSLFCFTLCIHYTILPGNTQPFFELFFDFFFIFFDLAIKPRKEKTSKHAKNYEKCAKSIYLPTN